jgi:hypothetical protein
VSAADDVRTLVVQMERLHPDLYHSVPRDRFRALADAIADRAEAVHRDETLVDLMRLAALPGERDGHTLLAPLGREHAQPLHAYPLRLYLFADGAFVTEGELAGSRLVSIGRVPLAEVEARVRPLVSRDNDWTVLARLPEHLVCAEVLHGLGLEPSYGLERVDGERVEVELEPEPLGPEPPARENGLTVLDGVLVLSYERVQALDSAVLEQIAGAGRVVVDVRRNGGGDNRTYGPLVDALQRVDVSVLTGRATFSAAGNFVAAVEQATDAMLVGEPPGGSPNQYGDSEHIELPALGWTVRVATVYHEIVPRDERVAIEPHVPVAVKSTDYFAGRDPVLDAALR